MDDAPFYKQPWFWALTAAVVIVVAVVGANALSSDKTRTHTIVYRITGTGSAASISYAHQVSGKLSITHAARHQLPWTKTITVTTDPTRYGVSARSAREPAKVRLACRLTIDGKYVQTDHAVTKRPHVLCAGATAH